MTGAPSSMWTADRVERLVKLWNEGLDKRTIAESIGVTRAAVVGKMFRMRKDGYPGLPKKCMLFEKGAAP